MRRALLLVAVGVTALALVVGAALATPPKKATTTPLTRATLGKFAHHTDGIKVESKQRSADVAVAKVVLEPGGSTGWHHHPGVVMVSVKSGAVSEYHQDCHKTVYKAAKGFVEGDGEVHVARNEGNVDAVLYATFLATETPPEGLTIADAQPKNCDVE